MVASRAGGFFSAIGILALALTVFAQWMAWVVLTLQIWYPWSVILGIVVMSVQMVALFDHGRDKNAACDLPRRPE